MTAAVAQIFAAAAVKCSLRSGPPIQRDDCVDLSCSPGRAVAVCRGAEDRGVAQIPQASGRAALELKGRDPDSSLFPYSAGQALQFAVMKNLLCWRTATIARSAILYRPL